MRMFFDEWLLNRFSKFHELKDYSTALLESAREYQTENAKLRKQTESDKALIASLNRYIEALEGKAAMQTELIAELRERLNTLRAIPGNQNTTPK